MVEIKLYDDVPIDDSSNYVREKIAKSISDHILKNWDDVVKIKKSVFEDSYEVSFRLEL